MIRIQSTAALWAAAWLFGPGLFLQGDRPGNLPSGAPARNGKTVADANTWQANGTLLEACSCSVPCPCNFGQGPSNDSCHTIYAYRLKTARYGDIVLDGLVFGGGEGSQGILGFLDTRATAAQKPALEKLAMAVFGKGGASTRARKFETVRITAEDSARTFKINFEGTGGFAADILIGADGKNPIIVENNTTWPVFRFTKGKTTRFDYKDSRGNRLRYDGVNANIGEFKLSGTVPARTGRAGQKLAAAQQKKQVLVDKRTQLAASCCKH